jgi:hypothetical protein
LGPSHNFPQRGHWVEVDLIAIFRTQRSTPATIGAHYVDRLGMAAVGRNNGTDHGALHASLSG